MKKIIKRMLLYFLKLQALLIVFILKTARIGFMEIYNEFYKHGFHFLRKSYYLPIPEIEDLNFQRKSDLPGIDMNDDIQLKFMDEAIRKYKGEFNSFPVKQAENTDQYYLINGSFMAGDGNAYYSLIRRLKPKKILEIGSGFSTLLAAHAIEKNLKESSDFNCRLVAVEPYPSEFLLNGFGGLSELKKCKVQELETGFFESLGANDILFIDSSHVLRSGGDVWWEYCEILPRLNSGVYVHIHDISLPKPYPRVYYDSHLYWNEQYLLQAFLACNGEFEIVWAGTYMYDKYPETVRKAFYPEFELMREVFPLAEPSSFWMRRK